MERETKTFTTPEGIVFEVKTYLTGREKRELTNVYLKNGFDLDIETQKVKGINAELVNVGQDLAFKLVIVSISGKKEPEVDFVNFVLDLKATEFDFVVAQINEITADKSFAEKKTI